MVKREWNEDIDWLLNSAPGLLGERGANHDPSGGTGPRFIADTGPMHARMISSLPHVQRQRRLNRVWVTLSALDRAVLEHLYRPRQQTGDPGMRVAFGELAAVVCALCPDPEKLRRALLAPDTQRSRDTVRAALTEASRATAAAHRAWRNASKSQALLEAC